MKYSEPTVLEQLNEQMKPTPSSFGMVIKKYYSNLLHGYSVIFCSGHLLCCLDVGKNGVAFKMGQ